MSNKAIEAAARMCGVCKQVLSLEENFYKTSRTGKRAFTYVCKKCDAANSARRAASPRGKASARLSESRKVWQAQYSQRPERKAAKREAARIRYRDPARAHIVKAHAAVRKAIRAGILRRAPCEACGAEKAVAHHHDYSKPLDVNWLCRQCHVIEHYGDAKEMLRIATEQARGGEHG